jgi:serine/threonine-protein kinase RsbW
MISKKRRQPEQIYLRFKNPCYEKIVRENTEKIARNMGFDEDQIFDLTMAVDEAYANAIEHNSRKGTQLDLEIEYLVFENRLEILVRDSGCGFDIAQIDIPENLKKLTSDRGRGLTLIKALSDHFELLSNPGTGTMVKIVKFLVGVDPSEILGL